MAEILIHRCRLRLVRRDGWSWGPDPRALSQAAVRALPALLAAALEDLFPGEDEREISAPVRLRLRLRPSELAEALAVRSTEGRPPPGSPAAALAQRLAAALAAALAGELLTGEPESAVAEAPGLAAAPAAMPDDFDPGEPSPPGLPISRLLLAWQDHGGLAARLALLSAAALEALRAALLRECAEHGSAAVLGAEALETLRREAAALGTGSWAEEADRAPVLRVWLMAAVEIAARCGIAAGHPAVAGVLAEVFPGVEEGRAEPAIFDRENRRGRSSPQPVPGPPESPMNPAESPVSPPESQRPAELSRPVSPASPAALPAIWRDMDIHVASALPFLLLGPLSRTGYLETLAAVFASAGLSADLPLFAVALAYKVLPPPERGWRRTPAAVSAAAACAGLLDPVSDGDLSDLARRAAACLDPLAADLTASLLAGHEPGRPLLLAPAGGGLLLAEADGVFPLAWASAFEDLRPVLARLPGETLLVPSEAAAPALLREIDESGLLFVTAAPPTRGEPWRPLRLPRGERAWTNGPAASGLARQAAALTAAEDGARRLWQALAVERPSLPRAADPLLDLHLTLAAGLALGTLAWTLWRHREPVDPVLALERFGDLDARVRFRSRSIHVLLPMGRRHQDLFAHRLLEPVRDAAWLGGRALEFGGG